MTELFLVRHAKFKFGSRIVKVLDKNIFRVHRFLRHVSVRYLKKNNLIFQCHGNTAFLIFFNGHFFIKRKLPLQKIYAISVFQCCEYRWLTPPFWAQNLTFRPSIKMMNILYKFFMKNSEQQFLYGSLYA